jgi:hypothetical protein
MPKQEIVFSRWYQPPLNRTEMQFFCIASKALQWRKA